MIELFIISFAGFTSENDPDIKFIDTEKDGHDEIMVRPCIISLPNSSLSSASVATKCANAIMERLIKIQEPKPAGATISVNMIGVSESCGVIRFMLNNTLDTPINAVVVSACFDRARTPFGSPFSITPSPSLETSLNPTPPWFDWRGVTVDNRHHLLVCHGTQDLNPSTPFLDAWGFFLRTMSERGDVALIQVGGTSHGYACLSTNGVHHRMVTWLKERDRS
ncbi:hypothetical protein [Corynebacterium striatum]|uniref:hypothetical protein n=1 Tax=Corynebacterium striatum TaxID=43770 RepID=UPI0012FB2343|nr:hypothetical protein [Corynebacterium striatum]